MIDSSGGELSRVWRVSGARRWCAKGEAVKVKMKATVARGETGESGRWSIEGMGLDTDD